VFSDAFNIAILVAQFALIVLLLRGPVARYFPLFLYVGTYFAASLMVLWYLQSEGTGGTEYFAVFWGGLLLTDLLLLLLVLALTVRALDGSPLKSHALRFMMIVLAAALVLPFVVIEGDPFTSARWNNSLSQFLTFGAAIMNFGLWTALLVTRNRDPQLLTVSAGLGVTLASAAITLGMRHFTSSNSTGREIADVSYRVLQFVGLLIWCWAFRPARKPAVQPSSSEG
jgi:hypothetical protein